MKPRPPEPVGEVFTLEALGTPGKPFSHVLLNRTLPTGTKLYTEPPAPQQATPEPVGEPWGWAVNSTLFRGEFAEADAKDEAKRCGGTTRAVALYTRPAIAKATAPQPKEGGE